MRYTGTMNIAESKKNDAIPALCWLGLPLLWGVFQLVIELTLKPKTLEFIHSEYGLHENIQFVMIAAATILAISMLFKIDRKAQPWLAAWLALAAICCFFVSGEEISWGQTYLHWQTPGYWYHLNNQHETNLHNTTTWLNQKPRLLLEIGVVTGGLIIPLLRRFRPSWLPVRPAIIYPPTVLIVTTLTYMLIQFISTFGKHVLHVTPFTKANEVEELYLYYFVLLYMINLRRRLMQQRLL